MTKALHKNVYKYDDMKRSEHMAVRQTAGWYFFTHQIMEVTGEDAAAFLDHLFPNAIANLPVGRERYTTMLDENAEIIDDVVVFHLKESVYRELSLEFNRETHIWNLLSDDCEQTGQSNERIVDLLSALLREQPEICAPAKGLLEKIDPAGIEGFSPNSFSHQIRKNVDTLRRSSISVAFRKSNGERLICLRRVDGVDDTDAANIVPIDPAAVVQTSEGSAAGTEDADSTQ